jgi:predicted kinase
MIKLIATQGLPASGKSTWAAEQVKKNPGNTVVVNRDSLRVMLHGDTKWSKGKEKATKVARDALIRAGLADGLTVICDDTNIQHGVVDHLRELAREFGAHFETKDFTDVTPEECIKRDLTRDRSVGAEVIMRMFNDHLKPDVTVTVDESLPECVVVDVDGTLALHVSRGPFEYEKCLEDAPNPRVVELVKMLAETRHVVVCSGREGTEQVRRDTMAWLMQYDVPFVSVLMRPEGDMRKDSIIKREILERDILPHWNPVLVIDDRDQVVRMWRDAGLTCFQVAYGDF